MPLKMSKSIAFVLLTLATLLFTVWSVYLPYRPRVVGIDAPADVFSAARAEPHLAALAQRPHPVGSDDTQRVRRYLVEQLESLGLDVEVQRTPYLARMSFRNYGVQVENILVRIPGREPGPAALFLAHYDSAPQGPGAADNASAVAALLETLRALATGAQLTNDLIFLFSDAEEAGLLGAQAFHDLHPWIKDVRVVVNFDSRGYRGPLIMFETGAENARWLRELRAAGAPVIAASFSDEVYARMPNDNDFTVFKRSDIAGFNFAFIHDAVRYHTALDSLDNLDRRVLQQQGEIALALARRLGAVDLDVPSEGDAVYFNLPGGLVIYPMQLGQWLCGLAVLLAGVVLGLAVRRGHPSLGLTVAAVPVLAVATAAVAVVLLGITRWLSPELDFARGSGPSSHQLVHLGQALIAIGLCIAIYHTLRRKLEPAHLLGGGLILWALLSVVTGVTVPGASHLFALPLLAALPGAAWVFRRPPGTPALFVAALALPAVLCALLWSAPMVLIGVALGPTLSAVLTGVVVGLILLALLTPILALTEGGRLGWTVAAVGSVVGILVIAVSPGSFGEENRRMTSLFYVLDQESGEAHWYTMLSLDRWNRHYLGEAPEHLPAMPHYLGLPFDVRRAPAPQAPLERPEVHLRNVTTNGDSRTWQVELAWPPDVSWFHLFVEPRDEVMAVVLEGQRRDIPGGRAPHHPTLTWFAPPREGLRLGIEMSGQAPLELELVGLSYGLPEIPGFSGEPMPPEMMTARYSWLHGSTATRSVVTLRPHDAPPEDAAPPGGDPETGGAGGESQPR